MADFKAYLKTLETLTARQLETEVHARLLEFNRLEDELARRVGQERYQPQNADWMAIDDARALHRLAKRALDKRREARA